MKQEKTFEFKLLKDGRLSGERFEIVTVKESELSQPQKDLLLGEIVKLYKELPEDLQQIFIDKISVKNNGERR